MVLFQMGCHYAGTIDVNRHASMARVLMCQDFDPAESALCTMVLRGHEQLHLLVWVGACQCENLVDGDIFTVITDHPLICRFLRRH